jgi:hypothetical protein
MKTVWSKLSQEQQEKIIERYCQTCPVENCTSNNFPHDCPEAPRDLMFKDKKGD